MEAGMAHGGDSAPGRGGNVKTLKELTLDECLTIAAENNHQKSASMFAVAMAEAQHRQALSGYWPQISLKGSYVHTGTSPDFLFPAMSVPVPSMPIHVPGGTTTVTIPANAFGPGVPPKNVQVPVSIPSQTIHTPSGQISVPPQDVKLLNQDTILGSANAALLLFDGGMRKGLGEQATGWLDMVKQEARRTDLEIEDSVRRLFYGAVLAAQLHQVGKDTLARMEATLSLTETMYKEGSGKVKKTDYLDNKVMVESIRSMLALLEKNEEMAQAALANTMGFPWNTSVKPTAAEIPYTPYGGNLEELVSTAYEFNPDWMRVEAGIRAAEGAVRTAKSGFYPKVALMGELHKLFNGYDAGLATDNNKEGWSVGVGMEIAIFDGFLTLNKVRESRSRVDKIRQESFLLEEGIGLQIKDIFLGMIAAQKAYQATLDAMNAAQENRDLNTRAYQMELVETEKVIRAQLVESLMCAQHYKTRFDHIALQSQLTLVVGTEVGKQLEAKQVTGTYSETETLNVLPDGH
jgi:outer membrane protein TolC